VALLENGDVACWFADNGWSYPVGGTPARGIAAVQQFFECLGLSKPPPLMLSEAEVRLTCRPAEAVAGRLLLRTPSKKWVYAQVDSDAPWLRVTTPAVSGPRQAAIAYEVDPRRLPGEGTHQANLRVVANAGQKLTARIIVEVRRPPRSFDPRLFQPFLVGALVALLLRLLLVFPADLYARLLTSPADAVPATGSGAFWARSPMDDEAFPRLFVLATWWLGGIVGAGLVWRAGGRAADLFCGLVAGAGAGLAAAATACCVLAVVDGLPRALVGALGGASTAPGEWTVPWLVLAPLCWAVLGGSAGLVLCAFGEGGARLLAGCTAPLVGVCRLLGLGRLADFFALQ
jgi:hypothetical protein